MQNGHGAYTHDMVVSYAHTLTHRDAFLRAYICGEQATLYVSLWL